MIKVLANDGISKIGQQELEAAGYQVITDKVEQDNLADYINQENVSVLLVRSATTARKELIDACPGLKFIGRGGVGMDNIDVAYAREKGLRVENTPASSSQSVAELVMGHMFASARFLNDSYKHMETGDFSALKKKYGKGTELKGKTLGIIGFGRIGQSLASYALGCGMNVYAVDQYHVQHMPIKLALGNGVQVEVQVELKSSIEELLPLCDFVSLHVPKQKDGSAVIGTAEFNLMKSNAILVNAARGGVIDEDALLEALNSNKIAGCALDVFENEPNPRKDLLNNPKIACTPHIGAATLEAQDRIGSELASLIIEAFAHA